MISGAGRRTCPPTRHPTLTSTNPKCFDGDPAHGIFVSGLGEDTNPGTLAAPKRTLAAGLSAAGAQGKAVYVSEGLYSETLKVADGVSVFGGYNGSWQRSPSNITMIAGASGGSVAATATGIAKPTTLQLLKLAPSQPVYPGQSSYGLRGVGSPGLVLDHLTVIAAPGAAGAAGPAGALGSNGGAGHAGSSWPDLPQGGSSLVAGNEGGNGGLGGNNGGSGENGDPGQPTVADAFGNSGGLGGAGGARL